MYPHSGRRHYAYDRSAGSVVSSSLPCHGTTPGASVLACGSSYLPTVRRVNDSTRTIVTPTHVPMREDEEARRGMGGAKAVAMQPATMTDAERQQRVAEAARDFTGKHTPRELHQFEEERKQPAIIETPVTPLQPPLLAFLRDAGLDQFLSILSRHAITSVENLAYLSEADLREIGMDMHDRSVLREALDKRRRREEEEEGRHNEEQQHREQHLMQQSSKDASRPLRTQPHSSSIPLPPPPTRVPPKPKNAQPSAAAATTASPQRQRQKPLKPVERTFTAAAQPTPTVPPRPGRRFSFDSTHPPHPSHPPSAYDYLRTPMSSSELRHLREPMVPRAAQIPSSPRHLSPQTALQPPPPDLTPTTRRMVPPPPPTQLTRPHFRKRDPNVESIASVPSQPPRAHVGVFVPAESPLGAVTSPVPELRTASPPLVHAADYPLEAVSHGDASHRHALCFDAGEHQHQFGASRHPPHLSHPMPVSDILPHARHA